MILGLKKEVDMDAKELLLRLGAELDLKLNISDEGVCRIYFDDDAVDFELTEDGLCLIAELGIVPSEGNTELLRTLLVGNLFGIATAGAVLSIDPNTDSIYLHKILYNGLSYATFEAQVESFVKALRHWKLQISQNSSSKEETTKEQNIPDYSLRI